MIFLWFGCYNIVFYHSFFLKSFLWRDLQEQAEAVAEGKTLPSLYSSADVRSLKMEDFKNAHEQVLFLFHF